VDALTKRFAVAAIMQGKERVGSGADWWRSGKCPPRRRRVAGEGVACRGMRRSSATAHQNDREEQPGGRAGTGSGTAGGAAR